jgi:hypothetical protein
LSEDAGALTIFAKNEEAPILEIPISQIRVINRRPSNDVLTARLYRVFRLEDPD